MARTMPVHTGYTILNGSGTGSNGSRIQVWAEYLVGSQDVAGNRTRFTAYFYAALDPNYTSTTSYYTGLNSTFTVAGAAGTGVTGGSYDFTDPSKVNLLGSFDGWIAHGADGKKTVKLEGSFTTVSSYISGGSVSGSVTLPAIARAATPTAVDVTLGNACRVTWTPAVSRHSFSLNFSLGSWQLSTGRLSPNKTAAYTYTGTTLPLEAARQFTGAAGLMTVSLTTYDGDTALGTVSDTFTVTVPENDLTRPTVTATLSPVCDAFPGLYVEKLGKVSAGVTATDPLGAKITGYTIGIGGRVTGGTVSAVLDKFGVVDVTVTATNSRGFSGTWTGQITALAYESPRLFNAAACRCLSDGTADPGGTFLRITAGWTCSPVDGRNACQLRWRYQPSGGAWSDWQTVSAADSIDEVMPGIVLEKTAAYNVALEVVDTAGGTAPASFTIPIEKVYMHRTRDAMGLGGYADGTDLLDVHWDLQARQSVNGAYIRTVRVWGVRNFTFQTKWETMTGSGQERQSVFFFGSANGTLIRGVLGLNNSGGVMWDGTSGVSATANTAAGTVTVTLPGIAYDKLVLLSPDPIEIL